MADQVADALERLQKHTGKTLGDDEDPLLVSVRSGARESMPGMLDTVLNLGLNDTSVEGLARATENDRFAWDSYRRFLQMFGNVSRGIDGEAFEKAITEVKSDRGVEDDTRARHGRAQGARRPLQDAVLGRDRRGLPAGPAGAAAALDPRRIRLLDRRARRRVPPHQPHPGRVGHGGQRPADGVRQQGRHVRLRCRVQPRRGHRRARAQRRLPPERPGRGRRLRRAHAARHLRDEGLAAGRAQAADGDPQDARAALRGHAGHRVHGGGRAALHAPDARREAAGAGRGALRARRRGRGPARARAGADDDRAGQAGRAARSDLRPEGLLRGAGHGRRRRARCGQGRGRVHGARGRRRRRRGPRRRARAAGHQRQRRRRLPRRQGHPHQPRRQGLPRRARRPGDGRAVRDRGQRAAGRSRGALHPHRGARRHRRRRLHRDQRHDRRGHGRGRPARRSLRRSGVRRDPRVLRDRARLGRRRAPAGRARERGHAGRRDEGARAGRGGHRPVPHRAHVHGRGPPAEDAGDDHGRRHFGAPRRARAAAAASAGGLRGPL